MEILNSKDIHVTDGQTFPVNSYTGFSDIKWAQKSQLSLEAMANKKNDWKDRGISNCLLNNRVPFSICSL